MGGCSGRNIISENVVEATGLVNVHVVAEHCVIVPAVPIKCVAFHQQAICAGHINPLRVSRSGVVGVHDDVSADLHIIEMRLPELFDALDYDIHRKVRYVAIFYEYMVPVLEKQDPARLVRADGARLDVQANNSQARMGGGYVPEEALAAVGADLGPGSCRAVAADHHILRC